MEAQIFPSFLSKWLTSKLYNVNLHPVKIPIKGDCICLIDQKISLMWFQYLPILGLKCSLINYYKL